MRYTLFLFSAKIRKLLKIINLLLKTNEIISISKLNKCCQMYIFKNFHRMDFFF